MVRHTRSLIAGLFVAAVAALGSPAFARRISSYPEGSIFMQQPQDAVEQRAAFYGKGQ